DEAADASLERVARERDRRHEGADRRRGTEQSEPPRSRSEDVARIEREQAGDAAQEHGEQIEREHAQDQTVLANEEHAREEGLVRSEEHTSELQSLTNLVCRL